MLIQRTVVACCMLGGYMACAQNIVHQPLNPNGVTQIHTSLDHISVLALPERITRVAKGSDVMEVEWHENSVFIKPVKSGQSTNLMVWTEHQFSTYELEAPGDVKDMSSIIDETTPSVSQPNSHATSTNPSIQETQRIADSAISSTLLQVTPVTPRGIHPAKDYVTVTIKEVVRDKNSLYVRFAVSNAGSHPYRIVPPNVFTISPTKNIELLAGLKNLQITDQTTYQFQSTETSQIAIRGISLPAKDVQPGATIEGVLALQPADVQKTGVYEFVFGDDGGHRIQAMAVL